MLQNLTGTHALVILAVIVLIFGASKLPALARSLGQSVRILKTEAADERAEATDRATTDEPADRAGIPATPAAASPAPPAAGVAPGSAEPRAGQAA